MSSLKIAGTRTANIAVTATNTTPNAAAPTLPVETRKFPPITLAGRAKTGNNQNHRSPNSREGLEKAAEMRDRPKYSPSPIVSPDPVKTAVTNARSPNQYFSSSRGIKYDTPVLIPSIKKI
jgi:hypothetical protein